MLRTYLVLAAVLLASAADSAVAQTSPPRLLLVDVDDLGDAFLAANPQPFFHALDAYGRRYDTFYTAPLCCPTRASMSFGVRGNHPDLQCTGLIRLPSDYSTPTAGRLVTLAQALAARGFSAAKIGKWHLSLSDQLSHPEEHGYAAYFGVIPNVNDYYAWPLVYNGVETQVTGTYLTKLETDGGIVAMSAGYDLVSVSYHAIHRPYHVPPAGLYSGPVPTTDVAKGRAMLEALSRELGRLVSAAQLFGYHLILFSDNGGNSELGGAKGTTLEKGCNTTMWCFGAGVVPGVDPSLVSVHDIYATVLEFFGSAAVPPLEGVDSVSFLPTWQGTSGARTHVYAEKFMFNGEDPRLKPTHWDRVVRSERYKLRRAPGHVSTDLFFDLQLDPNEFQPLAPGSFGAEQASTYLFLQNALIHWERP